MIRRLAGSTSGLHRPVAIQAAPGTAPPRSWHGDDEEDSIPPSSRIPREHAPISVIVRRDGRGERTLQLTTIVLTLGGKGAVVTATHRVEAASLAEHLDTMGQEALDGGVRDFGEALGKLVFSDDIRALLGAAAERELRPFVVFPDAFCAGLPWETLHLEGFAPALGAGLSRKYMAARLSVEDWLSLRDRRPCLDVLLILDPTGDLDQATREGRALRETLGASPCVKLTVIEGKDATRSAVRQAMESGAYDVVHFTGHAYFSERSPSESGILCADGALSEVDLARADRLPTLVFFNACESARVGQGPDRAAPGRPKGKQERLVASNGFAEAFLRAGLSCFVGTYWPVESGAAASFAEVFYRALAAGETVGKAALAGRTALAREGSRDWADYVLYGPHDLTIREPPATSTTGEV